MVTDTIRHKIKKRIKTKSTHTKWKLNKLNKEMAKMKYEQQEGKLLEEEKINKSDKIETCCVIKENIQKNQQENNWVQ